MDRSEVDCYVKPFWLYKVDQPMILDNLDNLDNISMNDSETKNEYVYVLYF